jgi:hypothetical protein
MVGFTGSAVADDQRSRADHEDGSEARTRRIRVRPSAAQDISADTAGGYPVGDDDGFRDGFDDDDDYVEYLVSPARSAPPQRSHDARPTKARADDDDTEPLLAHRGHPRPAPAETWHTASAESWRSLLEDDPALASEVEPIGFAHNGFHVDDEQRFRPIEEFSPPPRPSRHEQHEERSDSPRQRNRHYRADPDDTPGHGRHSFRDY